MTYRKIHCQTCNHDFIVAESKIHITQVGRQLIAQVQCISSVCNGWSTFPLSWNIGLSMKEAHWVSISKPKDAANETDPITEEYIEDWLHDLDEDPELVKILELEL